MKIRSANERLLRGFAATMCEGFALAQTLVCTPGLHGRNQKPEAQAFLEKLAAMQRLEHIPHILGFVYFRSGFSTPALDIVHEHQIACSNDPRWLE